MANAPTSLRNGRYWVVGVLGEGAQAQTLDAVDKLQGKRVAIKRFIVRGARSWKDVELAEREARVLGNLRHPNLPGYVEHFEESGELYLVMEQIEGESLQQLRKRGVRLERVEIVRLLTEIGAVLAYLHTRNPPIIHRDIKPGNLIRRPDGSFALVDFGSVRDQLRPEGGSTVVGTFGYMAPEQFQGRALPQTDTYALGATVLSVLTGEEPENLPHRGLALDVGRAVLGDPKLARLIERLTEPDPDQRPSHVPSLLRELSLDAGPSAPGRRPSGPLPSVQSASPPRHPHVVDRQRTGEPLPPVVLMVCLIGLGVARAAVRLAIGFAVPTLLVVLSLVFGRALRLAAHQVRRASFRADQTLLRATGVVRRLQIAPETPADLPRSAASGGASAPNRLKVRVAPLNTEQTSEPEPLSDEELPRAERPRRARSRRRD